MNEALRILFLAYFSTHIPITLLVDAQALLGSYYPESLQCLIRWYVANFHDHLMQTAPVWFQSFIAAELLFQLPVFFFAVHSMLSPSVEDNTSPLLRIVLIVYGAHTSTTLLPILSEFLSQSKYTLVLIYLPYLVVPLLVMYVYGFNWKEPEDRGTHKLPMKVLVIRNGALNTMEYVKRIVAVASDTCASVTLCDWVQLSELDKAGFDAIIASGSEQGDDPMPTHTPHYRFLRAPDYATPFFGICTGHHLMGSLDGMELLRGSQSEKGDDCHVAIACCDPIFAGLGGFCDILKVKQMHRDSIHLPENFDVIASSAKCPVNMIKHRQKPCFYSTQFHPEYRNQKLLRNFLELAYMHKEERLSRDEGRVRRERRGPVTRKGQALKEE